MTPHNHPVIFIVTKALEGWCLKLLFHQACVEIWSLASRHAACMISESRGGRAPSPFFMVCACACKCPITEVSQTKVMFFFKMIKFLS